MNLNIRPKAVKHFNKEANEILNNVKELTVSQNQGSDFVPDLYVSAIISNGDIVNEHSEKIVNHDGNIIACFFNFESKKYGLGENSYPKLRELAHKIYQGLRI